MILQESVSPIGVMLDAPSTLASARWRVAISLSANDPIPSDNPDWLLIFSQSCIAQCGRHLPAHPRKANDHL
jgi:hypothetical protein